MKMRILITGTSHCAALRAAATVDPQTGALTWGDLDLRFAAVPNRLFSDMQLRQGVLTAKRGPARKALRHLNGQDRFALSEADAVVVCGGLVNTFGIARLYREARWFPLPSLVAKGGVPPQGTMLISEAAALAALEGAFRQGFMFPLLQSLRDDGSRPVLIVQEPRLSQDALRVAGEYKRFADIAKSRDAAMLSRLYDRAFLAASDDPARVILQPAATRAGRFFTDPAYRRGAMRMATRPDVPQPADDMLHANAEYGGLVLDEIARVLAAGAV